MNYKISKIAHIIDAQLNSNSDCEIQYVLIDSRNIISTQNALFFAIKGQRNDGHKYISDLYLKGVMNFVVEEMPQNMDSFSNATFLQVKNSLQALQCLAAFHRSQFKYPVIGITGSNGKTIVKEWLFHIFQVKFNVLRSPKSYNSQVGVPLSVWLMNNEYNMAIFEAGISLPGEMELLEKIIHPTVGLITNIGESHQENFSDYVEKTREKLKLFIHSDLIIYSKDQDLIHQEVQSNIELSQKKRFVWSENSTADLQIISKQIHENRTNLEYLFHNKVFKHSIPFTDKASVEDSIHALAVLCALELNPEEMSSKFESLPPVAMRMELKNGINNCTLINDSYNSDLNSLSIALNYLDQQNQHPKKTLIISDILQSGRDDKVLYKEISELIRKFKIDRIIGIGEAIYSNAEIFKLEKKFYKSTQEFLNVLSKNDFSNEAILLKGSRNFYFEKISALLEEKMHRTVLEINLNALVHNLNYFKQKLKPKTKIMIMVKALSYGSGTFEIANVLQYQRVDYLGVAFADEGVALREAGIKTPIMVMNPEQNSFDLIIKNKLEPELYNAKVLHQFNSLVKKEGIKDYPVHIKLDTGMYRLGFTKDELNDLISELKNMDSIKVASVFSHLAASDEDVHDDYTQDQIALFTTLSDTMIKALAYPIIRHISNSAAIERFPEAQLDMVRLGIGLYGISSIGQDQLATVSTLKSTVIQIKHVPKNETIGYSRKGKAFEDTIVAVIPIGYADGLNRKLSNGKGNVFINGFYVPIVGNICMDMCMVDVTSCNVHEGDEVIIFGKELPVTELAEKLETIPYEILTSVSSRVKRVYFQE